MVKVLSTRTWVGAVLGVILSGTGCFLFAQNRFISYLPRDEVIESVVDASALPPLGQVACSQTMLFQAQAECDHCYDLQTSCPNCCLSMGQDPMVTKCSADDTSGAYGEYDCSPGQIFLPNGISGGCSAVCSTTTPCSEQQGCCADPNGTISNCQNKGCPPLPADSESDFEPQAPGSSDKCIFHTDGFWYCTRDSFLPRKPKGCVPVSAVQPPEYLDYKSAYHGTSAAGFYDITPYERTGNPPSPTCEQAVLDALGSGVQDCYKYDAKQEYMDYITACHDMADEYEGCNNRINCCEHSDTCSGQPQPGFSANCNASLCQERITWDTNGCNPPNIFIDGEGGTCHTCEEMIADPSICVNRNNAYVNCLVTAGTACRDCFVEIDSGFFYEFVARSREKAIVQWIMHSSPVVGSLPATVTTPIYFYSLVRVEKASTGAVVHESFVHQKSFQGDFDVFAATLVPASSLEQGEKYVVRLYYFLPQLSQVGVTPPPAGLSVNVTRRELIVFRIR